MSCLCIAACLLGIYGFSHSPLSRPAAAEKKQEGREIRFPKAYDSYGRYILLDGKTEIVCPKQTDQTVVALVYGQSNSANMHGQRTFQHSARIVNFFNGKCYKASDPLLGASGRAGSVWTLTGTRLLETDRYDHIIFVPAGICASQISEWAQGGKLNPMLSDVIRGATKRYKFTHVVFHQGETDARLKTAEDQYRKGFLSMVRTIRGLGVEAPVYVSVTSFCAPILNTDNEVTKAQRELISTPERILPGPDTDVLNTPEDRFDDCHMSYTGVRKFSDLLMQTVFK